MLQGLGDPFYVDSPGLSFKLYPCSAPQFLAADATLHLVRQHNIRFEDVKSVELRLNPARYKQHYRPTVQSGLQGKFTTNYVCAMAVLNGRLDRASFTDAKVKEPKVLEAMSKVNVIMDETIPERGRILSGYNRARGRTQGSIYRDDSKGTRQESADGR